MQEQLTPVEKLSMAPFWSTFCGTSNGAWQGVQAAFSPMTGMPLYVISSQRPLERKLYVMAFQCEHHHHLHVRLRKIRQCSKSGKFPFWLYVTKLLARNLCV